MKRIDKDYINLSALSSSVSNQCVLIVDDNPDNIILLQFLLEEGGFTTQIANSGLQALEMLQQYQVDLVFLDLMMPYMNGIEVARWIRVNPLIQHIPIVLVTAYAEDVEDEDYSLLNGVLAKPIDTDELLLLLKLIINRAQTR